MLALQAFEHLLLPRREVGMALDIHLFQRWIHKAGALLLEVLQRPQHHATPQLIAAAGGIHAQAQHLPPGKVLGPAHDQQRLQLRLDLLAAVHQLEPGPLLQLVVADE